MARVKETVPVNGEKRRTKAGAGPHLLKTLERNHASQWNIIGDELYIYNDAGDPPIICGCLWLKRRDCPDADDYDYAEILCV